MSKRHHQYKALDHAIVELRAYQIHHEKGGSALDNWLEAEKNLKSAVSRFINEGDPNTKHKEM